MVLTAMSGIIMLLLTYLQPYTLSDDILYHCIWRRSADEGFVRIGSLADIVQSQAIHYMELTGRAIVQTVAQAFLGLLSKPAYDVANALILP